MNIDLDKLKATAQHHIRRGDCMFMDPKVILQLAELARPVQAVEPVALNIIRKWPDGFEDRLQHVWLDVVSFIPNVKLYDLQRVLAEFGFTMNVYEGTPPAHPVKEMTSEEQAQFTANIAKALQGGSYPESPGQGGNNQA